MGDKSQNWGAKVWGHHEIIMIPHDLIIQESKRHWKSFFRPYSEDWNPNFQNLDLNLDSIS